MKIAIEYNELDNLETALAPVEYPGAIRLLDTTPYLNDMFGEYGE